MEKSENFSENNNQDINKINAPEVNLESALDLASKKSIEKNNAAYRKGAEVSDLLSGYTNRDEQLRIIESINSLNSNDVMDFLSGYVDDMIGPTDVAKVNWQDFIYLQLATEDKFPEKEKLIKKVGSDVAKFAEEKYPDAAKAIKNICNKGVITRGDITELTNKTIAIMELSGYDSNLGKVRGRI